MRVVDCFLRLFELQHVYMLSMIENQSIYQEGTVYIVSLFDAYYHLLLLNDRSVSVLVHGFQGTFTKCRAECQSEQHTDHCKKNMSFIIPFIALHPVY